MAQQQIDVAKKHIRTKAYSSALDLLQKIAAEFPNHPEVMGLIDQAEQGLLQEKINVAKKSIREKNFQRAINLLESNLTKYPDHPEIVRLIGQAQDGMVRAEQREAVRKKWSRIIGGAIAGIFILFVIYGAISSAREEQAQNEHATQTQQAFQVARLGPLDRPKALK